MDKIEKRAREYFKGLDYPTVEEIADFAKMILAEHCLDAKFICAKKITK